MAKKPTLLNEKIEFPPPNHTCGRTINNRRWIIGRKSTRKSHTKTPKIHHRENKITPQYRTKHSNPAPIPHRRARADEQVENNSPVVALKTKGEAEGKRRRKQGRKREGKK
jgi:hypothetical protein